MNINKVKKAIENFNHTDLVRLKKLGNYYSGKHPILFETKEDGKPNNLIVNNFAKNITDTTVGYFMGMPVSYSSDDANMIEDIKKINAYNDEQFANSRLSKDLSVYGVACELLYYDSDRQIRFVPCDVTTVVPIWSDSIEKELVGAVRISYDEENGYTLEVYDDKEITYYTLDRTLTEVKSRKKVPHYFGQVPINFYFNNSDEMGDFESVISLIDAYNKLESESVNDFELFADSYLAITGMGATDSEDIRKLRENRVLLLDEGGDAKWLTKSVNGEYIENLKTRISSDIYRFSGSVDMTDDTVGQSASGVAIKYKLLNFENRVSVTERFFKKGLMRRYEMICTVLNTLGANYDWRDIKITFTRNLPENPIDNANYIEKMSNILSKKTILERVPFVEDVDGEIKRIKEEKDGE